MPEGGCNEKGVGKNYRKIEGKAGNAMPHFLKTLRSAGMYYTIDFGQKE